MLGRVLSSLPGSSSQHATYERVTLLQYEHKVLFCISIFCPFYIKSSPLKSLCVGFFILLQHHSNYSDCKSFCSKETVPVMHTFLSSNTIRSVSKGLSMNPHVIIIIIIRLYYIIRSIDYSCTALCHLGFTEP